MANQSKGGGAGGVTRRKQSGFQGMQECRETMKLLLISIFTFILTYLFLNLRLSLMVCLPFIYSFYSLLRCRELVCVCIQCCFLGLRRVQFSWWKLHKGVCPSVVCKRLTSTNTKNQTSLLLPQMFVVELY